LVTIWGAMLGPATGLSFSTDPVATVNATFMRATANTRRKDTGAAAPIG